jgi:hypothetical protein
MDRIRALGVGSLWLSSDAHECNSLSVRLLELARSGLEKILVIKLKSYAEMDLSDLLRFHCEKRNPVTAAQDSRGPLGVQVLNRSALSELVNERAAPAAANPGSFYQFDGYTKRLLSSQERQDLIRDALTGVCAMRPAGQEIRDRVWLDATAVVDDSARIVGPSYIGPRTIIHTGAAIGPFTSIERDCVVDAGTTVEHSSVLPQTYLAPGLSIQQSLVDGSFLEHLGWHTVADLAPAGLGHRIGRARVSRRRPFTGFAGTVQDRAAWPWSGHSTSKPYWSRVEL